MNQCSSVFTHAFFLRNSIFKMAIPVYTLKNQKPEYTWAHNDHVRVQTTTIIIVIIIISIIIATTIAIIFYSGQMLLSDHVCDDIVISEESFNSETCNLKVGLTTFYICPISSYFRKLVTVMECSLSTCAYVFSNVYNNICVDIFM